MIFGIWGGQIQLAPVNCGYIINCMTKKIYSNRDREIAILAGALDLIDSMVHFGHFDILGSSEEKLLQFKSYECSRLFLIVLADFLSYPRDGTFGLKRNTEAKGCLPYTHLGYLDEVAQNPSFEGDTSLLGNSVREFASWLDGDITIEKVWFPSIDYNDALKVKRVEYLRICGTASKHGFTRLGRIVSDIRKVMCENNNPIDEGQGYLLLPDFQERFRDDIFIASATTIAWHLNEIRWGIIRYLENEFSKAYRPSVNNSSFQQNKFDVPRDINDPLIKSMYWNLMNDTRQRPTFDRFTVDPCLRDIY